MLNNSSIVSGIHIWEGVCSTGRTKEKGVARGIVTGIIRI